MGQFWVFSVQFWVKREFFQNSLLFHCEVLINHQLKYLMNQSRENYISMENGPISGIFGPIYGQKRILPN